jgi:hypothetical protein
MPDNPTTERLESFMCPGTEIVGEPGVGLTFYSAEQKIWLCWPETVELHAWLTKLLEAANDTR